MRAVCLPATTQHVLPMHVSTFLVSPLVLFLGSCSLLGPNEPALKLTTNQQSYVLDGTSSIEVTAENVSSQILHFTSCMPVAVEEVTWSQVVGTHTFPTCECICKETLQPGERWTQTISTQSLQQYSQLPLDLMHHYRVRLAFYRDEHLTQLLPVSSLYSNLFSLTN